MNIDEVKRNAPEGSTHYRLIRNGKDVEYYMKPPYGLPLIYYYGCWKDSEKWHGEYSRFIKPL